MKTILDIGANNLEGFDLLKKIEAVKNEDKKIFVEANPECWLDLENYIKFIPNSSLIKKALDTDVKTTTLVTRADKNKDIGATIMGKKFLTDGLKRWNMSVDEYNYYDVETTTILNIIEDFKIDTEECIFKLDAEGVEYGVLNQILENNILFKKIYCEFHVFNEESNVKRENIIKAFKSKNQEIIEWH